MWVDSNDHLAGPDIYFSSSYGRAVEKSEAGQWSCLSLHDGRWLLPLLVRDLPSGRRDAISPYGYSGVFCDPGIASLSTELWRDTIRSLREKNIVSVFVRESPLVPQAPAPPDALPVVQGHSTFLLPALEEEKSWSAMRGSSRTSIRKARREGVDVVLEVPSVGDLAQGSPFRSLYEATMHKVGARDYYYFGDEYFENIRFILADKLLLARAIRGEVVMAAGLFMVGSDYLHYHLSGSSAEAASLGCSNIMLWEALCWARRHNLIGLHLGGGVKTGDGLERFKRSFGGVQRSYNAYGMVVDSHGYGEEIRLRTRENDVVIDDLVHQGFFPAYRAPQLVAVGG